MLEGIEILNKTEILIEQSAANPVEIGRASCRERVSNPV